MIYITSDHAGYKIKKRIVRYLTNELKIPFEDLGPDHFEETDDYPDFASKIVRKVIEHEENIGITICGFGNGMCISTNKAKGIRAALGFSIEAAKMARIDNHANILSLAGRVLTEDHALAIVKKFIDTPYSDDKRHIRRVNKISELEK